MPATGEAQSTNLRKVLTIGITAIAIVIAGWFIWRAFSTPSYVVNANTRWFVDTETGKPFQDELKAGTRLPIRAPSGKQSGYLAELCYWNADGSHRKEPSKVVLNSSLGKPEPTFCPDCGRLVVGHNPAPGPNSKPPPKKEEYIPGRGGGRE
jgi:hypothetical protein